MLRARVDAALLRATAAIAGRPSLAPVRLILHDARERFAEPMRVALAGRVSTGKSTLANALIGGTLLCTGPTALTHTVTELRYAPRPSLLVRYRDGTCVRHQSLDPLAARPRGPHRPGTRQPGVRGPGSGLSVTHARATWRRVDAAVASKRQDRLRSSADVPDGDRRWRSRTEGS